MEEFDTKSVRELRLIARSRNLKGFVKLPKKDLIKLLITGVRPLKSVSYKYRTIVGYKGESFESFDVSKYNIHVNKIRHNGYLIRGVNLDGRFNSIHTTALDYNTMTIICGWHISSVADFVLFGIWYINMVDRTAIKSLYRCAADVINSNQISMHTLTTYLPLSVIRDLIDYNSLLQ